MAAYESIRHASKAAKDEAQRVASLTPRDRAEARRFLKREAARADTRFSNESDEMLRAYEAVYASEMRRRAEALR